MYSSNYKNTLNNFKRYFSFLIAYIRKLLEMQYFILFLFVYFIIIICKIYRN